MSRVEAALQATGWEKMQTSTSPAVSVTQWRHKEKFGGGLYLLLSIVELNAGTQHYFGTVEAFPFWRNPG